MVSTDTRPAVLMVDDRPDNLLALEAVLEPLDVRLVRATSGRDALRWLLTDEFAVILLDVQMPGLDGFETARHVKQRERTRHIPIIFLTAISREDEHQLRGYDTGAVDYLAKPFAPEVLRSKVAVFVQLYERARLIATQRQLLAQRLEERDRAQAALARQAIELERSNAELERFAAVASHDLREPLHVVNGFLDLLDHRHSGGLDEDGRLLVAKALDGVSRMDTLIGDLLDYSRASTAPLELTDVQLEDVLAAALAEVAGAVEATDATVTHDPLPAVRGDRWQLTQLFTNLLDNAIKFRDDKPPEVHVSLSRREATWVVTVRDNGIGIAAESLPRLFTLFARLHAREDFAGEGIGLAVCRRVAERHGGTIWAESTPGRGTAVSVSLSVAEER